MSINLSDQQAFEVVQYLYKSMEAEEAEKLLDLDHLDTFKAKAIKPLYPHKPIQSFSRLPKLVKFQCGQICCQLSSGSTCCGCCCQITPPDQMYQEFGLGANIYFNFINHFTYCFLFLSLLSVVSIGIAYWISLQNEINPLSNYQVFFFTTTMGSFSANYMKCKYAKTEQNSTVSFLLRCPKGEIHEFGLVKTQNSQESLANCKYEREKILGNHDEYIIPTAQYTINRDQQCTQNSCFIAIDFAEGFTPSSKIIAFSYACVDASYPMFSKANVEVRVWTYIFVGLDLFITVGFLFFLCSQKKGEENQIKFFKQFQLTLKDFSVKISGFKSKTFDKEFNDLLKTLSHSENGFERHIIEIKTPNDEDYLEMSSNRQQEYQKLFEFIERNFFSNKVSPLDHTTLESFKSSIFPDESNFSEFKQELNSLLENYRNSYFGFQSQNREMSIFLVFRASSDIKKLKNERKNFCCKKYLETRSGNQYKVEEAPVPDMLQWKNKTKRTFLRVIFSWIITLGIVLASFIFFGWIQWEQKKLLSHYNFSIDCQLFYSSSDYTAFREDLYNSSQAQYTQCYCGNYYFSFNVTDEVSSHCQSWWRNYLLYLIIPILISVGLVVYNVTVSFIFKKLTQLEGHFYVTNEMFSYILKRSFILIMNMGLIIVLLNFNYNKAVTPSELFFLFQGEYRDITSDWYISIGSIIIMTMIFNILTPFMELLTTSVFKCLRKCVDKRCWRVKTSQKYKEDFISLYSGDIYPIEERYALVISIFWITMLFNCVIPALNVITGLSLLFLKLIDKFLLFKFFKTPINFDESLHRKFMKIMCISIIVHLAASAFLLSEPNLVPRGSNFSGFSALTSSSQRLNTLIQTYYIIPYVGLCFLLIVYAIFRESLLGLALKCCKKDVEASAFKSHYSQSFIDILSERQLNQLKTMLQKKIIRLQNSKLQKKRQTTASQCDTESRSFGLSPNASMVRFQSQGSTEVDTQLAIYRNTYGSVMKRLQDFLQGGGKSQTKFVGMPGYEILASETEAEKEKKMLELDSILEHIVSDPKEL